MAIDVIGAGLGRTETLSLKLALERHNATVRAAVPAGRLARPGDGWKPLCDALGLAVPSEPFPHANTTADFQARNFDPARRGTDTGSAAPGEHWLSLGRAGGPR